MSCQFLISPPCDMTRRLLEVEPFTPTRAISYVQTPSPVTRRYSSSNLYALLAIYMQLTYFYYYCGRADSPVVWSPGWEPARPRSNPIGIDRVLRRGLSPVETEQCVCVCLGALCSQLGGGTRLSRRVHPWRPYGDTEPSIGRTT